MPESKRGNRFAAVSQFGAACFHRRRNHRFELDLQIPAKKWGPAGEQIVGARFDTRAPNPVDPRQLTELGLRLLPNPT